MDAVLRRVAAGAASDAGGLDPALLADFLEVVTEAAGTGRRLRSAELERYGQQGAVAATAGVALRALVDLYLSAGWRLWDELPVVREGSAAQVRAAGLAVLRATDDGVAALVEGFQLARTDLARRQEELRNEVLDALLAGGPAAVRVLGPAADLGVDVSAPHAVLVGRELDRGFADVSFAGLLGRLEREIHGRYGDAAALVAVRDGLLVVVFAAPDRAAVSQVVDRVTSVLADRRWQAAVGRRAPGADGVRASYEQARDALDLAARLALPARVVQADDLAVYRVLLRDREAAEDLVRTRLGPLEGVRGGAGPLLETLEVFYTAGGVATEAARRLHLSVRALTYRLARVRAVLGTDPADPAERLALHAAVTVARLLRWPDEPLERERVAEVRQDQPPETSDERS